MTNQGAEKRWRDTTAGAVNHIDYVVLVLSSPRHALFNNDLIMQKIMFNDKYGLTKAVLEGRKTMTRRVIKAPRTMEGKDVYGFSVVTYRTGEVVEVMALDEDEAMIGNILPKYKVGDIVAVAQSYEDAGIDAATLLSVNRKWVTACGTPGWRNKMFVSADYMNNFIRITNVRVERLQDISDEDCLREGVDEFVLRKGDGTRRTKYSFKGADNNYLSPRDAFATLIDRISGKGTWKSNPWVFVYEFELVK